MRRLGFADADSPTGAATGSSTRLSPGDVEDVRRRVKEHPDTGADHVALQVLTADSGALASLPLREWRELSALLD